jgi:hypothetical protein
MQEDIHFSRVIQREEKLRVSQKRHTSFLIHHRLPRSTRSPVLAQKHSTLYAFCPFVENAPASNDAKNESSTQETSKNVAGQPWK